MSWQLSLAMIAIVVGMPLLCGLVSWEAGRYEHRQHRRNMDAREAVIAVREQQLQIRERRLGQQAHDFHVMTRIREAAILDDTTIVQVLDWSEPA